MFTSVCTTSSYCRMLEGERGEKKVKLEPTRYSWNHHLLCWICCSSKTNANPSPLPLLRHEGPGRLCRKPKARGILSLPGASQPAQPSPEEPNQSPPHLEQEPRAGLKLTPGWAQAKHPCSTSLVPSLSLEGEAAQRKGNSSPGLMAQPPVRGGQSLTPQRSCSQTHLDSSPVASTPKCSHTAGQNCSLQVMKSSSRLARAEERVNNPSPFPEEPSETPLVFLPSLWEKP